MERIELVLIVAAGIVMLFLGYRYLASRMRSWQLSNEALEQEVEDLQTQLDISVRKEERSSKEAGQVKSVQRKLLTTLSHEVRTPLNGIMGMASLLAETPLNTEQLGYARTIHHSGEQLLITVNNLLASSALELSKSTSVDLSKTRLREFSIRDCIEECIAAFIPSLKANGPDVYYDLDPAVPEQVKGDRQQLYQLLVHLVENALRHTSGGWVSITVRLADISPKAVTAKGELNLHVEVSDTGEGIAPDRLATLFSGAVAPDVQSMEKTGRQGLGLTICKQLVEGMKGSINAYSKEGLGTTIRFSITLSNAQPSIRGNIAKPVTLFGNKEVLLIDANALRRTALNHRLRALGLTVRTGATIAEGVQLITGNVFPLALVDADGLIDLHQLAALQHQQPGMPILLLKKHGNDQAIHKATGEFIVLSKPLRQHELGDKCWATLSRPAVTSPAANGYTPARQFMKVLIAEDHPVNQTLAMKALDRLGYKPDIVSNGQEVLDAMALRHYDLIFMDIQMPEMDGLEATRVVRSSGKEQPIIIAMTANAMNGDRDECLQAGMDDYICKPLNLDELAALLQKWQAMRNATQHQSEKNQ